VKNQDMTYYPKYAVLFTIDFERHSVAIFIKIQTFDTLFLFSKFRNSWNHIKDDYLKLMFFARETSSATRWFPWAFSRRKLLATEI